MKKNYVLYNLYLTTLCAMLLLGCKVEKEDLSNGCDDLYLYNTVSKTTANLTNTPDVEEFGQVFSHDGNKIIFYTLGGIYSININGQDAIKLTDTQILSAPSISPDDKTIVFGKTHLYLMNVDGTNTRRLTVDENNYVLPQWSPDGLKIVCFNGSKLYLVAGDGTAAQIDTEVDDYWASWHADSKKLVYSKSGKICTYNTADNKSEIVTLENSYSPSFNRSGDKIAFISKINGNHRLIVSNPDGAQKVLLSKAIISNPAFSPDGQQIAFITSYAMREDNLNVGVCEVDGTNFRIINKNQGFCGPPLWSSDGKYILYSRRRLL